MRTAYRQIADLGEAVEWLGELGARSVIIDVEPLVATWNTDATLLRTGFDVVLDAVSGVPTVDVVGFATNSLRRIEVVPTRGRTRVFYIAIARKPFITRPYRDLRKPAVLIGDQVATDGLLAWRLGFAFAHLQPGVGPTPRGSRWMRRIGRPLLPLLFESDGVPPSDR